MTNYVPVDSVLPRLAGIRQTSNDRWIAKCPAHDDRNPSLSVRACEDGTLLVRCWAGCDTRAVMHAIDLELRDLFPRRVTDRKRAYDCELTPWQFGKRSRRDRLPFRDALELLRGEAYVLLVYGSDIIRGRVLTVSDVARAAKSIRQIEYVYGGAHGSH